MCLPRYLCICRPTGEYRAEFFSKKIVILVEVVIQYQLVIA